MTGLLKKRWVTWGLVGIVFAVMIGGAASYYGWRAGFAQQVEFSKDYHEVPGELRPLAERIEEDDLGGATKGYLTYYGLTVEQLGGEDVRHWMGTFVSEGNTLVGHVYRPAVSKGTVVAMHGYLNHTGQMNKVMAMLLAEGYTVCGYDMAGHGLSGGQRYAVKDFGTYSQGLADFLAVVSKQVEGPYHVIGHSTGCAAIQDYLLFPKEGRLPLGKVILAAPLVESYAYEKSLGAYKIFGRVVDPLPRYFHPTSHDEAFCEFVKEKDPLQGRVVPMDWIEAMFKWNEKVAAAEPVEHEVLVIQGKEDKTVQWDFNVPFIQKKFSPVEVFWIDEARHDILNESPEYLELVLGRVKRELAGS